MAKKLEDIIKHLDEKKQKAYLEHQEKQTAIDAERERLRLEWIRLTQLYENAGASSAAGGAGGGHKIINDFSATANITYFFYKNPNTSTYYLIMFDSTNLRISNQIELGVSDSYGVDAYPLQGKGIMFVFNKDNEYYSIFVDTIGNIVEKTHFTATDSYAFDNKGLVVGSWFVTSTGVTLKMWNGLTQTVSTRTFTGSINLSIEFLGQNQFMKGGTTVIREEVSEAVFKYYIIKSNYTLYEFTANIQNVSEDIVATAPVLYENGDYLVIFYYDNPNDKYNKIKILNNQGNFVRDIDISAADVNSREFSGYGTNKFVCIFQQLDNTAVDWKVVQYNLSNDTVNQFSLDRVTYTAKWLNYSAVLNSGNTSNSVLGDENIILAFTSPVTNYNGLSKALYYKVYYIANAMTAFASYEGTNDDEDSFSAYLYGNTPAYPFIITNRDASSIVEIIKLNPSSQTVITTEIAIADVTDVSLIANGNVTIIMFLTATEKIYYYYDQTGTLIGTHTFPASSESIQLDNLFIVYDNDEDKVYKISGAGLVLLGTEDDVTGKTIYNNNGFYHNTSGVSNILVQYANGKIRYITPISSGLITMPTNTSHVINITDNTIVIVYKDLTWKVNVYDLTGVLINTVDTRLMDMTYKSCVGDRIFLANQVQQGSYYVVDLFLISNNMVLNKTVMVKTTNYNYSFNDFLNWNF